MTCVTFSPSMTEALRVRLGRGWRRVGTDDDQRILAALLGAVHQAVVGLADERGGVLGLVGVNGHAGADAQHALPAWAEDGKLLVGEQPLETLEDLLGRLRRAVGDGCRLSVARLARAF